MTTIAQWQAGRSIPGAPPWDGTGIPFPVGPDGWPEVPGGGGGGGYQGTLTLTRSPDIAWYVTRVPIRFQVSPSPTSEVGPSLFLIDSTGAETAMGQTTPLAPGAPFWILDWPAYGVPPGTYTVVARLDSVESAPSTPFTFGEELTLTTDDPDGQVTVGQAVTASVVSTGPVDAVALNGVPMTVVDATHWTGVVDTSAAGPLDVQAVGGTPPEQSASNQITLTIAAAADPNMGWTKAELIQFAADHDPPIDVPNGTKAEILAAILAYIEAHPEEN